MKPQIRWALKSVNVDDLEPGTVFLATYSGDVLACMVAKGQDGAYVVVLAQTYATFTSPLPQVIPASTLSLSNVWVPAAGKVVLELGEIGADDGELTPGMLVQSGGGGCAMRLGHKMHIAYLDMSTGTLANVGEDRMWWRSWTLDWEDGDHSRRLVWFDKNGSVIGGWNDIGQSLSELD